MAPPNATPPKGKSTANSDNAARLDGAGWLSWGAIGQLAGALPAALSDLRAIAEGMRYLPKMLEALSSIEKRTNSLDEEVTRMREAVESLNSGLDELKRGVGALEPHLIGVTDSLRPLHRVAGRMRIGRRDKSAD